jgi:hypothetical protein
MIQKIAKKWQQKIINIKRATAIIKLKYKIKEAKSKNKCTKV